MRNFQDTFETRKRSFISVFTICMTVALISLVIVVNKKLHGNFLQLLLYYEESTLFYRTVFRTLSNI